MRERGGPISEQIAWSSCGSGLRNTTDRDGIGEEGGGKMLPASNHARVGPIAAFRNKSSSVWLHFPHLELLFLFFAFEGVAAAAASILQHSDCPHAFYPALVALVSSIRRGASCYACTALTLPEDGYLVY